MNTHQMQAKPQTCPKKQDHFTHEVYCSLDHIRIRGTASTNKIFQTVLPIFALTTDRR